MIRHIVSWKLAAIDEEAKSAAFTAIAEALGGLPPLIPEIKTLHIARDIDENEANWDVVLVVDYNSTADLAVYQTHPEHLKAAAIVRSHVTERATVDFEF
jgi:predicted metal-dependent HD superfamily phosphohydrolase